MLSQVTNQLISRDEILQLEAELNDKKQKLFNQRLNIICENSTKFQIEVNKIKKEWTIGYSVDCNLNYSAYHLEGEDSDSGEASETINKNFIIRFGTRDQKMFLTGGGIAYKIYRNYSKQLQILDATYEFDDPPEVHIHRIREYITKDIPEKDALKILLYFRENQWNDEAICHFIGTV